jgi:imidazolonepropionase-like amidohydrolase
MSLAITGGFVFDGLNEELKNNKGIYITDGKISNLDNNNIKADTVIDASNCCILPGLINAHVHLIWDAGSNPEAMIADKPDSFVVLNAYTQAQKHLALGITTLRDTGSIGTSVLSLRDAINSGIVKGPNILSSGAPIAMTGGHIHRIDIEADGVDAVRAAARLNLKNGVDFIKLMATGGVYSEGEEPGSPQLTTAEMKAAIEEAHKKGKKVTAHAEGLEGIMNVIEAGIDIIEHANYADDHAIEEIVAKGIYVCPTIVCFIRMTGDAARENNVPEWAIKKAEQVVAAQEISFKKAVEAGVKVITGTDFGAPLNIAEDYYTELNLMKNAGMSNFEVLKSCTSRAAEAIGLNVVGTIEMGKMADILIIEGNPLEDLTNLQKVRYVIKNGQVVVDKTMS